MSASWPYAFVRGNRSEVPGDLPHEMPGYLQINLFVGIKQLAMPTSQHGAALGAVTLYRYPSAGGQRFLPCMAAVTAPPLGYITQEH